MICFTAILSCVFPPLFYHLPQNEFLFNVCLLTAVYSGIQLMYDIIE